MRPLPNGKTVTILRTGASPERDAYGAPIPSDVTRIDVAGCALAPRLELPDAGGVSQQARDTVINGVMLYAPPGTVILTTDQVEIDGVTYEVTGQPGVFGPSPFTGTTGPVQVALDAITG